MKTKRLRDFKVRSWLEGDVERIRGHKERPPKSAKLVSDLVFGANPGGGGDYRVYQLTTNRPRSTWILWLQRRDDEGHIYTYRIATGRPYRGYTARFAAEQLLTKCWEAERDASDEWPCALAEDLAVWQPGLLSIKDINRIREAVVAKLKPEPPPSIEEDLKRWTTPRPH